MPRGQTDEFGSPPSVGGAKADEPSIIGGANYAAPEHTFAVGPFSVNWKPYTTDDLRMWDGWSSDRIADLQMQLFEADYLDDNDHIIPGTLDRATRQALSALLADANGVGAQWGQMLTDRAARVQAQAQADRPPLVAQVHHSADLAEMVDQVAWEMLGHRLDPNQNMRIVGAIQSEEARAQTDAFNAQDGTLYHAAADPELFTRQQVYDIDPETAETRGVLGAADMFFDLLGGPT